MSKPPPNSPSAEQIKEWHEDPLYKSASQAYALLVKKGYERHLIDGHLRRIVSYKDIIFAPAFCRGAALYRLTREMLQLSRRIQKIARRVEKLRSHWAVWGRYVDAGCIRAPEELRDIAKRIDAAHKLQPSKHNSHRAAIIDLLDQIQRTTGRYHYSQVADLINAAYCWPAIRRGEDLPDPSYDVDSLKAMIRRQKQIDSAKAARWRTASKRR